MKLESYNEVKDEVIDLSCTLKEGEQKTINISNVLRTNNLKIIGNIKMLKNSFLNFVQVDLCRSNIDFNLSIEIYENAEFKGHIAAYAKNIEQKRYAIDTIHIGKYSQSHTSMFGVCANESKMDFLGKSDIKNGASKTNTRQEGKIINLSGRAKCIVSPALLIAEEDVYASHGATMGSVPDDDIFYLMSRGIDRHTAERLVTIGYLKPIILMLNNMDEKEQALRMLDSEL